MWTREAALQFINELYPSVQQAGYHIGLTGSILTHGESKHDLDLIFYPATTERQNVEALELALQSCGLKKRWNRKFILRVWNEKGSQDTKHVETWVDPYNRRVDVFRLT